MFHIHARIGMCIGCPDFPGCKAHPWLSSVRHFLRLEKGCFNDKHTYLEIREALIVAVSERFKTWGGRWKLVKDKLYLPSPIRKILGWMKPRTLIGYSWEYSPICSLPHCSPWNPSKANHSFCMITLVLAVSGSPEQPISLLRLFIWIVANSTAALYNSLLGLSFQEIAGLAGLDNRKMCCWEGWGCRECSCAKSFLHQHHAIAPSPQNFFQTSALHLAHWSSQLWCFNNRNQALVLGNQTQFVLYLSQTQPVLRSQELFPSWHLKV